jgi:hypothetical protein
MIAIIFTDMNQMIRFYTFLFSVLFTWNNIFAQEYKDCVIRVPVFVKAETAPNFSGQFQQYFEKAFKGNNLVYTGEIVVTMVIDSSGNACCTKIENCDSASLTAKLKEAVDKMTGWKPATQNGHPVRFYYRLRFIFNGTNFQITPIILTTNTVCNFGDRTYTKPEYAPTYGNNSSDLQNFFDSAVNNIEKIKLKISLTLIIDTVGRASVSHVFPADPSMMDEKGFKEIINTMPRWNPARVRNCNVNSAIGIDLIFDKKSVRVSYVKNQTSPN